MNNLLYAYKDRLVSDNHMACILSIDTDTQPWATEHDDSRLIFDKKLCRAVLNQLKIDFCQRLIKLSYTEQIVFSCLSIDWISLDEYFTFDSVKLLNNKSIELVVYRDDIKWKKISSEHLSNPSYGEFQARYTPKDVNNINSISNHCIGNIYNFKYSFTNSDGEPIYMCTSSNWSGFWIEGKDITLI
jgi:hypothetical protein